MKTENKTKQKIYIYFVFEILTDYYISARPFSILQVQGTSYYNKFNRFDHLQLLDPTPVHQRDYYQRLLVESLNSKH